MRQRAALCMRNPVKRPRYGSSVTAALASAWPASCTRLVLSLLAVILLSLPCACRRMQKVGGDPAGSEVSLTERFFVMGISVDERGSSPSSSFERHFPVVRRGLRMDATVLVAPVAVSAPLTGISGKVILEGLVTPVFNVGDGVQVDIFLTKSGARQRIYSRFFDAGRKAEERDWIPVEVPMELEDSGHAELQVQVSAGPQGDLVADWLAITELKIHRRATEDTEKK